MKRLLLLSVPTCLLAIHSGCGPGMVVKRFVAEARGATSEATAVPGSVSRQLRRYRGVTVAIPRTDLGGLVSADFKAHLRAQLRRRLATDDDAPFPGGEPRLTLQPRVMWYDGEGGGLLGSDAYAVVLFELTGGGDPLGKVQIVTRSAASRTGDEDMAEDMAKELAEWFEDRLEGKD